MRSVPYQLTKADIFCSSMDSTALKLLLNIVRKISLPITIYQEQIHQKSLKRIIKVFYISPSLSFLNMMVKLREEEFDLRQTNRQTH